MTTFCRPLLNPDHLINVDERTVIEGRKSFKELVREECNAPKTYVEKDGRLITNTELQRMQTKLRLDYDDDEIVLTRRAP